jgi:hypothetical protein
MGTVIRPWQFWIRYWQVENKHAKDARVEARRTASQAKRATAPPSLESGSPNAASDGDGDGEKPQQIVSAAACGLWLRYELFRGRLSEAQFQASDAGLGDFIKARGNTKPHLTDLM